MKYIDRALWEAREQAKLSDGEVVYQFWLDAKRKLQTAQKYEFTVETLPRYLQGDHWVNRVDAGGRPDAGDGAESSPRVMLVPMEDEAWLVNDAGKKAVVALRPEGLSALPGPQDWQDITEEDMARLNQIFSRAIMVDPQLLAPWQRIYQQWDKEHPLPFEATPASYGGRGPKAVLQRAPVEARQAVPLPAIPYDVALRGGRLLLSALRYFAARYDAGDLEDNEAAQAFLRQFQWNPLPPDKRSAKEVPLIEYMDAETGRPRFLLWWDHPFIFQPESSVALFRGEALTLQTDNRLILRLSDAEWTVSVNPEGSAEPYTVTYQSLWGPSSPGAPPTDPNPGAPPAEGQEEPSGTPVAERGPQPSNPDRTKTTDLGGVDWDSEFLDLKILRDAQGMPLPVDQQPLEQMQLEGIVPVILQIGPTNISYILGRADAAPEGDGQPAPEILPSVRIDAPRLRVDGDHS